MPKRIQRKRTKGWKMPPNTVYVGRPSMWGNPYTGEDAIEKYRKYILYCLNGSPNKMYFRNNLKKLRSKNFACWCPLDKPCHADILLKIVEGIEND